MCNGCMACIAKCKMGAITIEKQPMAYNAVIDEDKCISCKSCYSVCPRNNDSDLKTKPIKWYQGWAGKDLRGYSTSGGAASAIITEFIHTGGYVCSCIFHDGEFRFKLSNEIRDVKRFAGSKYVKSNPEGIYSEVNKLLREGEKVLFLGLPCQVAAVKNYIPKELQRRLFTVDLICHGTPSPELFVKYLSDHNIDIFTLDDISFRSKGDYDVRSEYKQIVSSTVIDRYLFSFLKKLNYTENCYSCQFATLERVSDLTLGDSWGSKLEGNEQKRGISLLLSQTEKGNELINNSDLQLFDVDLDTAVQSNAQLQAPAKMPVSRSRFFELYNQGMPYDKIVFKIAPKMFIKQRIKRMLINLHIIMAKKNVYQISIKEL